jgi:hypothetical protein
MYEIDRKVNVNYNPDITKVSEIFNIVRLFIVL